jgi:hypothetical protein
MKWNDNMKKIYPNWKQLRHKQRIETFWMVVGTVLGVVACLALIFFFVKWFGVLAYFATALICILGWALWYNSRKHKD